MKTLCLKKGIEKPVVSDVISKNIISMCILGVKKDEYPKYFTHTKSDKSSGKIVYMGICETSKLMEFLYNELHPKMNPKRTCVHLCPNIYLQRKGGGKTDKKPDDIQMKFKFSVEIEKLFTTIFTQTISQ